MMASVYNLYFHEFALKGFVGMLVGERRDNYITDSGRVWIKGREYKTRQR